MGTKKILLALDKDYKKCPECGKLFHIGKTTILMKKARTHSTARDCFICGWDAELAERLISQNNITMIEVEETFGNLYEIQYTIDDVPMFVFIEKTEDSSI